MSQHFLEVINQSGKNIMECRIYRHPCMDLSEFNNDYLNSLSEKLLREKNKHIILTGDFNADFLKCTTGTSTAQFLDQMYSSSLLPHITSPYLHKYKIKNSNRQHFFLLTVQKNPSRET